MKINMGHVVKGIAAIAVCSVITLSQTDPAQAVLEGSNRERMEFLDFSESIIKNGLYAKTGKDTFNRDKKTYVRGIKRHNEPKIYQPDVYTWELAMAEHRKKISAMLPAPNEIPESKVTPIPMIQDSIMPNNPGLGRTGYDPKAEDIKRRIAEQMGSLKGRSAATIPALQPAMEYPRGNRGDSCDASF